MNKIMSIPKKIKDVSTNDLKIKKINTIILTIG